MGSDLWFGVYALTYRIWIRGSGVSDLGFEDLAWVHDILQLCRRDSDIVELEVHPFDIGHATMIPESPQQNACLQHHGRTRTICEVALSSLLSARCRMLVKMCVQLTQARSQSTSMWPEPNLKCILFTVQARRSHCATNTVGEPSVALAGTSSEPSWTNTRQKRSHDKAPVYDNKPGSSDRSAQQAPNIRQDRLKYEGSEPKDGALVLGAGSEIESSRAPGLAQASLDARLLGIVGIEAWPNARSGATVNAERSPQHLCRIKISGLQFLF